MDADEFFKVVPESVFNIAQTISALEPDITANRMYRLMQAYTMVEIMYHFRRVSYIRHSDMSAMIPKYIRDAALAELEKRNQIEPYKLAKGNAPAWRKVRMTGFN